MDSGGYASSVGSRHKRRGRRKGTRSTKRIGSGRDKKGYSRAKSAAWTDDVVPVFPVRRPAQYRNDQAFIRGAQHVPPSKEAVRECMPVFFELLETEPDPAVRAVLGHFVFACIHPYMDGNGRIARFLLNLMLATAGHNWTIIPVDQRTQYMHALEQASSAGDIGPFAALIARLTNEQRQTPLPRPG